MMTIIPFGLATLWLQTILHRVQASRARMASALHGVLLAVLPFTAYSAESGVCARAIERAAAITQVPVEVLWAIALVESGLKVEGTFAPQPWTTNEAGTVGRFATRAQAEAHIRERIAAGVRNIDIGCLQVNHHWHGHNFPSAEAMLDPAGNAVYAASYLANLRNQTGDWATAIGAYHSRQPDRARNYVQKVLAHIQDSGPPRLTPPLSGRAKPAARYGRMARTGSVIQPARGQIVDFGRRSGAVLPDRTE